MTCLYSIETLNANDEKKFFADHYQIIYQVVLETLTYAEQNPKGKKNKIVLVLNTLKRLLQQAPEIIKTKWQSRSIGKI